MMMTGRDEHAALPSRGEQFRPFLDALRQRFATKPLCRDCARDATRCVRRGDGGETLRVEFVCSVHAATSPLAKRQALNDRKRGRKT